VSGNPEDLGEVGNYVIALENGFAPFGDEKFSADWSE
jgi:hypothetical protein